MRKLLPAWAIGLLLLLLGTTSGYGQLLRADGRRIVNDQGQEVILRGMGLGGWMLQEGYMLQTESFANPQYQIRTKIRELVGEAQTQAFYDAWLANYITKRDVDSLARWGFNSIRVPLHYNLFTAPIEEEPVAGQNTWRPKGFELTDRLLAWCKANRIYLILDLHAAPGGQGTDAAISDYDPTKPSLWQSAANRQKTVALWRRIAEHYANEPWIGGYDLINETNWGFTNPTGDLHGCSEQTNAPLKALLNDITTAIREVDKQHIIYVEGNCWAGNHSGLWPMNDNNVVMSFHKYWNANTKSAIQGMLDQSSRYNVPLWMGESGENSNSWHRSAIQLLEQNHIGWSWWTLKKVGLNTPLEVRRPAAYEKVLNYWKGSGARPSDSEAVAGLAALAEAYKIENTFYHPDYIDALFRQVATTATRPFQPYTLSPTAPLFAVNYDLGRNGAAYYDLDTATYHSDTNQYQAWNQGWVYRNDGVDIETNRDAVTNGYNVGWISTGEWLQYTVQVPAAGLYDVQVRIASASGGGQITLSSNGLPLTRTITLPSSGSWSAWTSAEIKDVYLAAGTNALRLHVLNGGFNLNYLQFSAPHAATTAPQLLAATTAEAGRSVVLTFNQALTPVTAPTGFSVKVNGTAATVSAAAQPATSPQRLVLTLATPVTYGDVVTVSYAGTTVTNTGAVALAAFTDQPVTLDLVNPATLKLIPGRLEAEALDVNEGVTVGGAADVGGGSQVGYLNPGDYFGYNVTVKEAGTYRVDYRVASANASPSVIRVSSVVNGQTTPLETLTVASTGGWQTWQTVTGQEFSLAAGSQQVRIDVVSGEFNLNWMQFRLTGVPAGTPLRLVSGQTNAEGTAVLLTLNKPVSSASVSNQGFRLLLNGAPATVGAASLNTQQQLVLTLPQTITPTTVVKVSYDGNGTVKTYANEALQAFTAEFILNKTELIRHQLPGRMKAAEFSVNSGLETENSSDTGGGLNVGHAEPGDYLDFVVNVTQDGMYQMDYRVASESTAGVVKLQLLDSGTPQDLHTATFAVTGGWQTWRTFTVPGAVPLTAGRHVLRVLVQTGSFNLNWLEARYQSVLSSQSAQAAGALVVYPNPSHGSFRVRFADSSRLPARLVVRDLTGRAVLTRLPAKNTAEVTVQHQLSKGIYLLEAELPGGKVVQKLVVE
ncbi:carbohydrate-binding protein [Hymenobacter sp. HSC-4F20]|uniref:carbohydrate-binding protein n=1 Tax=Hymenobacter sp. HSC-4F20 TaxID=2864135 RepID=UPI001C732E70|nr:carbohydrate-binding protein [Hymenobacter sp. HSC-4F20]MBX0292956.1 carbohydrate-binding protein [Hymenobacter sp. HSC-4F20]